MKRAILWLLQFLVFLAVIAAGSFASPFGVQSIFGRTPRLVHIFVWDGLLLGVALWIVVLLAEYLAKRLRSAGVLTTLAFIAAAAISLVIKLGFITHEL